MFSNEDYLLQLLTEAGLVSDSTIAAARSSRGSSSVIEKLVQSGQISQEDVAGILASSNALEYFDLANATISPDVANSITDEVARRYKTIPVYYDGYALTLAIADPCSMPCRTFFPAKSISSSPHLTPSKRCSRLSTEPRIFQTIPVMTPSKTVIPMLRSSNSSSTCSSRPSITAPQTFTSSLSRPASAFVTGSMASSSR